MDFRCRLFIPAAALLLAVAVRADHTFTSVDVGEVAAGSTTELVPGKDFELRGFGSQFGLHVKADAGRFVYTKLKGDFDITVQVRAIESEVQNFGEVGLLVRQDLSPTGLQVGQFVSSNFDGEQDQYTFIFRNRPGGRIDPWQENWIPGYWGPGSHGSAGFGYFAKGYAAEKPRPRPFPYVWLRLIRTGDTYRGLIREYLDSWQQLGMTTLALGEEVYVGLAISANHHSRDGKVSAAATNASLRNLTIVQP